MIGSNHFVFNIVHELIYGRQCHLNFDFLCYIALIHSSDSSIADLLNDIHKCFNDNNDTFSFVII